MKISVVIPVYRGEYFLWELYDRLVASLSKIADDFEIILVNDHSPQNDWEIIKQICEKDSRVKGINLSKNFGQHRAISAGLDHISGDWIVVMDCDLQDQPEEIIKLYNKAQEGYDLVFGRRYHRKDSFIKKLGSNIFYKIFNYFTNSHFDNTIANFSISKRLVIENLKQYKEQTKFFPVLATSLGFKLGFENIEHSRRDEGKSSYSFKKLLMLALNIIVSHSNKPLRVAIFTGVFIAMVSFLISLYVLIKYLFWGIPVAGWASIMLSIWFLGGVTFAFLGIIGLYLGKVFDETKARPIYIIKEIINA
ncbi:MAG: glycosyltransferase family 2 protein [Candidatus Kapabacteria bacterium]|nr:glycosyltransferase family 2 protein [Candidatus Kapabacteria bacterium]